MAATKKSTAQNTKAQNAETPKATTVQKIEVDPHEFITVRNGTIGTLIYISSKTGETFEWEEFGDSQEMELQELRAARAANKKFFERNWFMFDPEFDWVIDYLGVRAFYKHAISIDSFDGLFSKKPAEIKKIVRDLSEGQKNAVKYKARQLVADGGIDSRQVVQALEESLGVELIER